MAPHFDLNYIKSYKDKDKDDKKKDKDDDKDDKDYYEKLIRSHLEKKGKRKYWSNISRKSDTNNDLI